jgi:cytosine/creatinine deaminase
MIPCCDRDSSYIILTETRKDRFDTNCHRSIVSSSIAKMTNCKDPKLPYPLSETETAVYRQMLAVAFEEAQQSYSEGGIPIGAALFTQEGKLISRGHNRRVQEGDPSIHGETDAFRRAGRQASYRDLVMVTTLAPCWYCSGLVRQFRIGTLIVGESRNFQGGVQWLRENGVQVVDLDSQECVDLLASYIAVHPEVWNEDIGELPPR